MNRRQFLKTIVAVPLAAKIKPLGEFFDIDKLHGIPYHETNASTGTWMGITRSNYPMFSSKPPIQGVAITRDVFDRVRKMMDDAVIHYQAKVDAEVYLQYQKDALDKV